MSLYSTGGREGFSDNSLTPLSVREEERVPATLAGCSLSSLEVNVRVYPVVKGLGRYFLPGYLWGFGSTAPVL